jgi:uncharacterized membrane protein
MVEETVISDVHVSNKVRSDEELAARGAEKTEEELLGEAKQELKEALGELFDKTAELVGKVMTLTVMVGAVLMMAFNLLGWSGITLTPVEFLLMAFVLVATWKMSKDE